MHYLNGRPAMVGDKIVGKTPSGEPIAGVVVRKFEASDRCNLEVVALPAVCFVVTAGECLPFEDLGKAEAELKAR